MGFIKINIIMVKNTILRISIIINKRKEVIASERYIKFIIKHQNKLQKRYYSENVPKKYRLVSVLRARKLLYANVDS